MFETAGVCSVRRVVSSLAVVSLAVLLGACVHPSPPDFGGPKSWIVENVASKTTEELYADVIKPAEFERSSSKVIDGYTVESGNLIEPDKSVGSLVTVRSADGGLTALVGKGHSGGVLHIDSKGGAIFNPQPAFDENFADIVPNPNEKVITRTVASDKSEPKVVDVLIGYSKAAVLAEGGDAKASALALVELMNLVLRNSLVTNISLRLAGVQVVATDHPMSGETMVQFPTIFSAGITVFEPDIIYGVFLGKGAPIGGTAFSPGRMAIGMENFPLAFVHEVGHNVGGGHCHEGGSYNYGFNNGKNGTYLCGDDTPYFSNPTLRDEYGLPRGNSATADMARYWRENAETMSSYAPPFIGQRMSLIGIGGSSEARFEIDMPARYQAGLVALDGAVGPVKLAPAPQGYTRLAVKLRSDSGDEREVYLRAERAIGECEWFAMNAYAACPFSGSTADKIYFKLTFNVADNPTLPRSIYNGGLKLEARNLVGSWKMPVAVLVSVAGGH